ncbi:MAG: MBL fold metallo-hydrolase [Eubacteriales bacterium]|nr:MBL fold metallo-hydrolase [Eubacteriales bacterium]
MPAHPTLSAQDGALKQQFSAGMARDDDGNALPYRLFAPQVEQGQRYPLVLFLHGAGERGDDNDAHLNLIAPVVFARAENQKERPCFICAPQVPKGKHFMHPSVEKPLLRELRRLCDTLPVDAQRIYITGLSMGGIGVWHYIGKYPRLFAAALPVAGAGDPFRVAAAGDIPVWAFHGAGDANVPVEEGISYFGLDTRQLMGSRRMVRALREAGNPNVRYTECPQGYLAAHYGASEHASWLPAYENREAMQWLFAQSKTLRYTVTPVCPGVWAVDDCWHSSFYLVQGSRRAALIDTGMGAANVKEWAQRYTPLPVICAVTHAHGDHMRRAGDFDEVYVSQREEELPEPMRPSAQIAPEKLRHIKGGDTVDLGEVTLEVHELPGHTPGSVVFVDHAHRAIFTGDAVGSGTIVLMAVPGASSVSQYRQAVRAFLPVLEQYDDYAVYGGHQVQKYGLWEDTPYVSDDMLPAQYNPVCKELLHDMICLCDGLLAGDITPQQHEKSRFDDRYSYKARYGRAEMVLWLDQIR